MKLLPLIALIGTTASPTLALAQAETPQWFVSTAAQDGMLEVELAKLASARSQNPEVARFANRIVMVRAEANTALTTLAVVVPGVRDHTSGWMLGQHSPGCGFRSPNCVEPPKGTGGRLEPRRLDPAAERRGNHGRRAQGGALLLGQENSDHEQPGRSHVVP